MSKFRGLRPVRVPALLAVLAVLVLMTGVLGVGSAGAAASHSYRVEKVPNPPGAANAALDGISCPVVAGCIAVGFATTSPHPAALIETYAGGTWTPKALQQGFGFPGLGAVWCASMTSCVAVGDEGPLESDGAQPLVETLSDGTWTPDTPPLPATGITGSLDAISCVTAAWCVAAGFVADSQDNTYGLIEVLSNGTWTPEIAPTPSQSTQSGIRSVQCFTPTSCDAVGFYGGLSSSNGLLETLSGNEWTASALGGAGILDSVSCPSSSSCLAVGSKVHGGSYTETLSGTTWTGGTLPRPGAGNGNGMAGVSCPKSVSSCVAMGGWHDPQPHHHFPRLLVETESHGTWTPSEIPAPSGLMNVKGIACPKISACVAIGPRDIDGGPAEAAIEQPGS
jgi:hypothetical protein